MSYDCEQFFMFLAADDDDDEGLSYMYQHACDCCLVYLTMYLRTCGTTHRMARAKMYHKSTISLFKADEYLKCKILRSRRLYRYFPLLLKMGTFSTFYSFVMRFHMTESMIDESLPIMARLRSPKLYQIIFNEYPEYNIRKKLYEFTGDTQTLLLDNSRQSTIDNYCVKKARITGSFGF